MKKNFYDVNDAGKALLWCIILPQLLYLAFEIILMGIGVSSNKIPEELLKLTPILILSFMIAQIAFLFVFLMFKNTTNQVQACKIRVKNFGWQNTLICILIGVLGLLCLSPIANLFAEVLDAIGFEVTTGADSFLTSMNTPWMLILAIILIAGVPAVLEELIFRGIIFQGLRKFGATKAILITSALFAMIHLSAEQLIFPFLFSIILCWVVLKTNSIVASMIIHFVSNATSILFAYFNVSLGTNVPLWAFVLIAIGALAVGGLVIYGLSKLLKNTEKNKSAEDVMKFIQQAEKTPYNSDMKNLKIAIIIGAVLWSVNFIYGLGFGA